MSRSGRGDRTRQFVRATGQFARTVYAELTGAGYRHDDVLRFVNEVMELLSEEVRSPTQAGEPPGVFDAEAGALDRATVQEVLDFELKRAGKDRRRPSVALLGIDVVIPSWVASAVQAEVHALLAREIDGRLRSSDALGKLGPDRYLVVLPESKPGVAAALKERLGRLLRERGGDLPEGLTLRLRWARDETRSATASVLIEACFSQPADILSGGGADEAKPAVGGRRPEGGGGKEVVLCLGGGAARAASHAGVLAALDEKGIEVVGIAGSSGGALVGAMRAKGMGPDEIVERFASFSHTRVYRSMVRAYAAFWRDSRRRGRRGVRDRALGESSLPFYSESQLAAVPQELLSEFVEYFVGADRDIASLAMPVAVTATDLGEGRAVVLSHGSLHAALQASSAVPGLFPLQEREGRQLADGAAVSEVPIGAAHVLGVAAPVLAVHLEHPKQRVAHYRSSAEVVSRMSALIHQELVREQLGRARFLISLPVQKIGWLEFDRAEESAAIGKRAARRALAEEGISAACE